MKKATNHTVPQKFSEKNKKLINYKKVFAVLAVFTVIIICLTAMTASKMNDAVNEKTTNYVQDVSLQLAAHIDFRLQNNIQNLELVAAGVMGIGEYENTEELQMFLKSQMKKLGFNSFIIVSVDGDIHSTSDAEIDIGSMNGLNSAFKGKNGVDFLDEQSILYSIPIYSGDEIKGALGGIRDKKNMQKLIRAESFSGQSMTCITDTNGNVVISPEKLEPFLQLDGIFNKKTDIETVENIYMMKENMEKKIGGEFIFTAVNGERLILSYDPLESYDWVLLTLVPVDLISSEVNFYVKYTFVIIFVIISAFVIFLITAFKTYGKYYRQLRDFAFTDSVTGKINNAAFQIKCAELIENAKPNTYSVVLINIRNFKLINENSGSAEGDRTLKYVMDIISKNINEDEIAARADADNFFLCIKENNKNVIDKRLKGIISDINSYNDSMEKIYRLTLKQGVYIVDDPTLEITVMQDRAKTACRSKAADEDERCIYYDSSVTKQMKTEQELNDSFENSIKNRDFKVYFRL